MRTLKVLACCTAVGSLALAAAAQQPGGGGGGGGAGAGAGGQPRQPGGGGGAGQRPGGGGGAGAALPAEKAKAAWELEATGVAKRLSLNEEQTKALVKAYGEARTSHDAAREKLMKDLREKQGAGGGGGGGDGEGGGRRGGGMGGEAAQAIQDLNKSEREKLQKSIGATLGADQATKAMASLGTFSSPWDHMVDTVAGFKLEAAKQQDALVAIEDFVTATGKARAAGPDGDREAMRNALQDAREKLNTSMKKVLSEEQMTKFEEATRAMGRGMGGGRGGAGAGAGEGGGDGTAPPRRGRGGAGGGGG